MAALAGALGQYFHDVGDPVEQIRATVPVSLRPVGVMPPETLGNDFALVFCPFPVGIRDPRERLAAVKAAMDKLKASPAEAIASVGLLASMGMSPRAVEDRLVGFYGAKSSLVVSNVPGPRQPISLAGTPVTGVLPWAPQSGPVSTSVTILSYAGRVFVGVATDPALVDDPQAIVDAFTDEVAALSDPISGPRATTSSGHG